MPKNRSNLKSIHAMFLPMNNEIKHFSWGSYSSLSNLFGIDNSSHQPQAEIWMGAHPNGCSTVLINGQITNISTLIEQDKALFLGENIAKIFGQLPYLFKVLAADKALSIQVHPNKLQAQQGFERENTLGINLTAKNRNFKDKNHKPELVYALTEYQAMNGFRPISDIIRNFLLLEIAELSELIYDLVTNQTSQGLAIFCTALLSLDGQQKSTVLAKLLHSVNKTSESTCLVILDLAKQHSDDLGLFTPLLLNVITLNPGEAMYLDAQTPHAYLKGTGLEIMANSDNVLRAGLTDKYIDIKELIACTLFDKKPVDSLLLTPIIDNNILHYPIPVADFKFAIIQHANQHDISIQGAEILLALDHSMLLTHKNGESCKIKKGQSVFVPAYAEHYAISSKGRVARAYN